MELFVNSAEKTHATVLEASIKAGASECNPNKGHEVDHSHQCVMKQEMNLLLLKTGAFPLSDKVWARKLLCGNAEFISRDRLYPNYSYIVKLL